MTHSPAMPLDNQLCFSLYATTIAINRTYKPMLDSFGVTYPQYLVLNVLWEEDGQTIGDIASRLSLEPSTITPLVKRLEQAEFLSRQRKPDDERQVAVSLTKKGKNLQKQMGCLTDTLLQKSGMKVAEIIALNTQVQKLRDALNQAMEDARD